MEQGGRENLKTAKLHSASKQNATSAELAVEIAEKNQTKLDSQEAREADQAFLQDITTKSTAGRKVWRLSTGSCGDALCLFNRDC